MTTIMAKKIDHIGRSYSQDDDTLFRAGLEILKSGMRIILKPGCGWLALETG